MVPATVKENWKEKYNQFFPGKRIKVLYGWDSIKYYDPDEWDVFIMNYDILPPFVEETTTTYFQAGQKRKRTNRKIKVALQEFASVPFEMIILDEVQKIASEKAKTYHAVKYLTKEIPYILGLSATPIENKTADFFNILNITRPDLFPNRWKFKNRYCGPQKGWKGRLEFKGSSNTKELYGILTENLMIGHKLEDVWDEIPEKTRDIIPIKLSSEKHYKRMEKEIDDLIKSGEKGLSLQKFEMLKQIVYDEKKADCFNFIDDLLTKFNKILIFCNHTKVIEDIEERYGEAVVKINGQTKVKDRQKIIKRFNTVKKVKICACNTKAAGTGTDGLQDNCQVAVVLELPWTPAAIDQLEGRLMRIGQKNHVLIYYLLGMRTVEIDILEILDGKRKNIDKVMTGEEVKEEDLLLELIKKEE